MRPHILAVAQSGRLGFEALLLAASLARVDPGARLTIAEPQPEGAWRGRVTRLPHDIRAALEGMGAKVVPFTATAFGASYPQGNKIEALACLPEGEPFLFLDTDTLVTGPLDGLDLSRPSASLNRTDTWPDPPPYGPSRADIWASLYRRFDLDFAASQDPAFRPDDWRRYLYFNAGWVCGPDAGAFGRLWREMAVAVRDDPPDALACQSLDPWLDQVTLPLVVHALGGGRPGPALAGLDAGLTWHWRRLPLAYATGTEAQIALLEELAQGLRPLLKDWEPARELIFRNGGRRRVMPLARQVGVGGKPLRKALKSEGLWLV